MKNRVLIFFLLVISLMSLISWQILKSPYVSQQISFRLNKVLGPHNIKLSFSSVLPLLPLGTNVSNLKVEYLSQEKTTTLIANDVNIQFDLFSLFTHKVKIKLLQFDVVKIEHKSKKKSSSNKQLWEEAKKLNPHQIMAEIDNMMKKLPVNLYQIKLNRAYIQERGYQFLIPTLRVMKEKESVEAHFHFENYSSVKKVPLDSISGDVVLTKDALKILSLDVTSGLLHGEMSGVIKNYKNAQIDAQLSGEATELLKRFKINKIIQSGSIQANLRLWREKGKNRASASINSAQVVLPWIEFEKGRAEIEYDDNILTLMSANFRDSENGKLTFSSDPREIYDFSNKKLLIYDAPLVLENASLQNVLKVVDAKEIGVDAALSGNVQLKWSGKHIQITSEKMTAGSLEIRNVLRVPEIVALEKFHIWIPFKAKEKIILGGDLTLGETIIPISGEIGSQLKLESDKTVVNFKELGPFAEVPVKGKTKGKLSVLASKNKSYIKYDFSGSGVSVDGYFLGSSTGVINYSFKKNQLSFTLRKSRIGSAKIKGKGLFDFNRTQHSYFNMTLSSAEFSDVKQALQSKLPSRLVGALKITQGRVSAKVDFESVLSEGSYAVSVNAKSPYVFILGEPFENFQLSLKNTSDFIEINRLHLRKNKSALYGNALIDTRSKSFKYQLKGDPVSIRFFEGYQRLNLNFDTNVSIESHGQGRFDDYTTKTTLRLDDSYVSDIALGNSYLELYNIGKEYFLTADLFSKEITSSVYLNTKTKSTLKRSYAEFKVAVADLRKYLAVLNPSILTDSEISGGVKMELASDFNWKKLEDVNLDMNIDTFFLKTPKDNLSLEAPASLRIKDGKALKQGVNVKGKTNYITWLAHGTIGKDFVGEIKSQTHMRWANIIFSNFIDSADGVLQFNSKIKSFPEGYEILSKLHGQDISIMPKNNKLNLRNFSFDISQKNRDFYVRSLTGNLNEGDIGLTGKIVWHFPYPQIHLDYNLNGMKIDFLKNSSVVLSSYGKFFGLNRPYILQGALSFDSGNIGSELSEISGRNEDVGYDTTYLPRIMRIEETPLIQLNLDYSFSNPLIIQNSLVELAILGKGKIQGDIENIKPVGDITLMPGQSKFMFKGNDFIISKGLIRFSNNERSNKINPSLLIVGQASVSQHTVIAEVKGDMEKPLPELRSQPALSQADILSLLTIGITSNQANNMDERERQLATSVGIGSIFANQLRLGKELNNMFGVKLSVTPELSQDGVNYADAISSTGNATKLKNSTKIKLRKQIADNVEFSFSSTVGGTSEQIQKINVNYNLNDNISLEGLYETRESTIENRLTQPESIGVDLKMIMEFE